MEIEKFENEDYPSLYRIADNVSLEAQKRYLKLFKIELGILIIAAAVGIFTFDKNELLAKIFAAISAVLFAASIVITSVIKISKYENTWYNGRAIAESVKTLTWRYLINGEPFTHSIEMKEADTKLTSNLKNILEGNSDFLNIIPKNYGSEEQITEKMRVIRNLDFEQRKEIYKTQRIKNQLDWYKMKADINAKLSDRYFLLVIICQSLAFIYSMILIFEPKFLNATSLFATVASALLSWLQVKKHQELAQSYSVTAQDIGLIVSQEKYVDDDDKLSVFVGDTENAFSREHTIWLARRDVFNYKFK